MHSVLLNPKLAIDNESGYRGYRSRQWRRHHCLYPRRGRTEGKEHPSLVRLPIIPRRAGLGAG